MGSRVPCGKPIGGLIVESLSGGSTPRWRSTRNSSNPWREIEIESAWAWLYVSASCEGDTGVLAETRAMHGLGVNTTGGSDDTAKRKE